MMVEFITPSSWKDPIKLSTGINAIDLRLGGGLPTNGIIEISGESGSGKTQLCLQLCLTAQQDASKGGLNGSILYICTEDVFPSNRLQQLISTYPMGNIDFGSKIYIEHIPDYTNLKDGLLRKIPRLIEERFLKLVIIDSVAALFRGAYIQTDNNIRTQDMRSLGAILLKLNTKHDVCVITVNQATACLTSNQTVPALGLAWSNLVTTRIQLHRLHGSCRQFQVLFSPSVPEFIDFFEITGAGLIESSAK